MAIARMVSIQIIDLFMVINIFCHKGFLRHVTIPMEHVSIKVNCIPHALT